MHFSSSLILALAAAAIAAPTPSNIHGRDATEVDQVPNGLEGETTIVAPVVVSRPKGGPGSNPSDSTSNPSNHRRDAAKGGHRSGASNLTGNPSNHSRDAAKGNHSPNGSPSTETKNPNHPRDAAKGHAGYAGAPNPETNTPHHSRDAKGGRQPGSPNPITTDPNHPRDAGGSGPSDFTGNLSNTRREKAGDFNRHPINHPAPVEKKSEIENEETGSVEIKSGSNPATHCC